MWLDYNRMPDGYETQYNLDPYHNNATQDMDNDGLTNYEEYSYNIPEDYNLTRDGPYTGGLNPINPDSDNDSLPHTYEIPEITHTKT